MSAESFRERLRRLRREVGAPSEPGESALPARDVASDTASEQTAAEATPSPAAAKVPAPDAGRQRDPCIDQPQPSVRARLASHDARAVERPPRTPASGAARTWSQAHEPSSPLAHAALAPATDLGAPRELMRDGSGVLARVRRFECSHRHGAFELRHFLALERALLAQAARDERLLALDLSKAVFLDTETSGLAGGTGTYVFLVGLGSFTAEGFELWQGFLAHPADERALLAAAAERIAAADFVVSFFGKSFDRHRLEDKMRVFGITPPFAARVHLDLYHPLRRAHRGRFENCRLKTLERELAGVLRADDLPGSFAPAAWFDFLHGRPHRLEGVLRHNQDDVLSLVALAGAL